ncbi:MAG TPA: VOC family protein [Hanamia sp.]|nr:VOC family protein [Hanamia sp.]
MNIPEGYQAVMPYLILNDPEEFIEFTQKVFNATSKYKEMREDGHTIRHAEMDISGSVIMCAQSTDQFPAQTANLFVYVDDADETYAKALENGATSINEPADQSYGRSCGVSDTNGNVWWITSPAK